MTFWDHLSELRSKLLISFAAVFIGAMIAHYFHEELIAFLLHPIASRELFFLSPLDPLFFILKIDLFFGCILALPVVNWGIFSFLRPAMKESNWLVLSIFYIVAAFLILCGLAYAYFVMAPISLQFLLSIDIAGIDNMITANSYLSFLLSQSLIIALVFQIPLFIVIGAYIDAFTPATIARKRPYVYVIGLTALAILTPTADVINLCLVSIPALIIFEISLIVARTIARVRRR